MQPLSIQRKIDYSLKLFCALHLFFSDYSGPANTTGLGITISTLALPFWYKQAQNLCIAAYFKQSQANLNKV